MNDHNVPIPINDEDFKQCYDVLQRLGESSRTLIYAFVLIYGALLLWALNAIVYPSEQQRLGLIMQKDADIIRCLASLESKANLDNGCVDKLKDSSLDYRVRYDKAFGIPPGTNQFDLPKIDSDYMQHELEHQLDRSSEVSQFNVPLLGVTSDRAWLWIVNIALGPLFYLLIRSSLANVRFLLTTLCDSSAGQPVRLLLLSVTQIISSSPQRMDLHGRAVSMYWAKFAVLCLIFMLPILVSCLLLYDWFFFSVMLADAEFRHEPEFIGGILTIPILLLEGWLCVNICRLLFVLSNMHNDIRMETASLRRRDLGQRQGGQLP
jgi:hypothetical protein